MAAPTGSDLGPNATNTGVTEMFHCITFLPLTASVEALSSFASRKIPYLGLGLSSTGAR